MNSQDFLTLNLVGAGAFILWYLVSRGGSRRPTRLNMHAKDSAPILMNAEPVLSQQVQECTPVHRTSEVLKAATEAPVSRAKSLNVMFNYNGHSWDAYEVLGVPAGASLQIVTEAYQRALLSTDTVSTDFLETAYRAILNKNF